MIVALASPRVAASLEEGLENVRRLQAEAAARGADIVCFPEAYLPGLRGQDFEVPAFTREDHERALRTVAQWTRERAITTILGIERVTEAGRQIAAVVFDPDGAIQGRQTKTQIDPSEDRHYVPGSGRRIFETKGVRFGIAICHEGWRYPETVRWAAVRGARIVFHPQHTGSNTSGEVRKAWGEPNAPYYERAMMCRGLENTIYFASVNYALRYPESATSLIDPSGGCQAHLPYGEEGVLVEEVDLSRATGLLASRFAPERYKEESGR
ncbi:MAG TPA: carbon-nitrogen hydrolase family protein [Thermoanaerobaculia bacterium]|nr:carbon-nitrogen hydrolase family protein [Thermoanaerobaculia bacterium]